MCKKSALNKIKSFVYAQLTQNKFDLGALYSIHKNGVETLIDNWSKSDTKIEEGLQRDNETVYKCANANFLSFRSKIVQRINHVIRSMLLPSELSNSENISVTTGMSFYFCFSIHSSYLHFYF